MSIPGIGLKGFERSPTYVVSSSNGAAVCLMAATLKLWIDYHEKGKNAEDIQTKRSRSHQDRTIQ
jgi:hypothetical protein